MTPDSRLKCSCLTVSNRLQTWLSVNRWLTIVFIACFSYTFQTREECVVHWYHYKKKEDHIKVRDSSLALYRRRVGGRGGSFSFLSENRNWSFFVVFPEKRIKNLVYSWKLVLEKGSHLLIPQNYLLASVENPWKGFVYLFAFEEQHWL